MLADQGAEGADAVNLHQVEQVLPAVGEVLTQVFADRHATLFQFIVDHVLEQGSAATATGAGLGLGLDVTKIAAAGVNDAANIALGDVVA